MHCQTILTLKTPIQYHGLPPPENPRLTLPVFPPFLRTTRAKSSIFSCKRVEIDAPKPSSISFGSGNGCVRDWKSRSTAVKTIDVATLGNLCVDIILDVPELPPRSRDARKAYLQKLSASPPDKQYWEAGGNCNMAIAAARLGLHCASIGHVGDETYGRFLQDVLYNEGIRMVGMSESIDAIDSSSTSYETLLCWVLVDPLHRHGFCSRADFSKEPAFGWMRNLSEEVKMTIKQSKVLFCNGYDFDELTPDLMTSALDYAVEVGTCVFFDPGPRGRSLSTGNPEEQRALSHFLSMSDVLLLTSDEAETLTGIKNPVLAGQELLKKGVHTKWVIVKMGYRGSVLITMSSISCAPGFKVEVIDTVGCGDSFVAAAVFGFIHNFPSVNTLAIANAVGAATAMGCGAGRNVATLKQVIELIRASNLNKDDDFWNELLSEMDAREINFLSQRVINGSRHQLNHISLQQVASQLLPKLQAENLERKVSI
ncbi:fructokinase-1-like [Tripterygium wilfordii]|uniref:fructokinase-1-like n=1 Tax=Tripterygium wilfordii TaxID=458696 RepID=UPI0018F803FD|nr:fructokinase-1-like [Tripterygium wilfordii]